MSCAGENLPGLAFTVARAVAWSSLLAGTAAVGFHYRRSRNKGWLLYKAILTVIAITAIEALTFLAFHTAFLNKSAAAGPLFGAQIFWDNTSTSAFLGLLLLLSAGFCITRDNLGPHKAKVVVIPAIILVTGLITNYILFSVETCTVDGEYEFYDAATWEEALWFFCSLVNLSTLLLSWVYIFDTLQLETQELDKAQALLTGRPLPPDPAEELEQRQHQQQLHVHSLNGEGPSTEESTAYKQLLTNQQNGSHMATLEMDLERGDGVGETVEDRLSYDLKKQLLSRFGLGVGVYLVSTVCVLMLPIFINVTVMTAIQWMQFFIHWGFLASLVYIFRPVGANPYLMIGASAEDADELGLADLDTELAMVDDMPHGLPRPAAGDDDDMDLIASRSANVVIGGAGGAGGGGGGGASSSSAGRALQPPPYHRVQKDQVLSNGVTRANNGHPRGAVGVPVSKHATDHRAVLPPTNLPTIRTHRETVAPNFSLTNEDDELEEIRLRSEALAVY